MARRPLFLNSGLVLALAGTGFVGWRTFQEPSAAAAAPRTATAALGVVQTTTAATGNVQPSSTLNVGFGTSGTITSLAVKAGDHVVAGQTLGTLDDTALQDSVAQATASLATANSKLATVVAGPDTATKVQLAQSLQQAQNQVDSASRSYTSALSTQSTNATGYATALVKARAAYDAAVATKQSDESACSSNPTDDCSAKLASDDAAVSKAADAVADAQTAQTKGLAKDAQDVATAKASRDQAVSSLALTKESNAAKAEVKSSDVEQAQAAVTQAASTLEKAQADLAKATLKAPSAGTISNVSVIVGQQVSASGVSAASSSSSTSAIGGGSSSSAPFTLADLDTLQVKVSVAEADATKLAAGQAATVSFDSLTGTKLAGKVVAVATTSTVTNNVVSYDVLVNLINPPATVRAGMSTSVSIITASREGVVRVTSSALSGNRVTVLANGVETVKQVTVGLRGDDAVEIVSGLAAGDVVVLPSSGTTGSSTGAATTNRNQTGTRQGTTTGVAGSLGGTSTAGGGGGFGGPPPGAP